MTRVLAAFLVFLPVAADAQQPSRACSADVAAMSAAEFVACARAGTEPYLDRAVAVADGYRRIGRDFPGMGEHWIRIGRLFDGDFHPARPEILTYIMAGGRPKLLGVAYAVPLLAGETPPASPAGAHVWHDHSRTIEEETVLPHDHGHGSAGKGARLAMFHAWIWADNPDGIFAADNWAIPFLRLKLSPDAVVVPAAGKALALVAGGRAHVEAVIAAGAALTASEADGVSRALDRAAAAVRDLVSRLPGAVAGDLVQGRLAGIWTGLWDEVDATVSDDARRALSLLPVR